MKKGLLYYNFDSDSKAEADRVLIMGRRGTGKSTGVKKWVADGHFALFVAPTIKHAETLPSRFVPPAVKHLLPAVEEAEDENGDKQYKFGNGCFKVIAWSDILNIRDTGLSVADVQPEAVIHDEAIRVDGRYKKEAPELLDDLAATLGRSGTMPKIVLIGNPIDNNNPFSTHWRVDLLTEGVYEYGGKSSKVVGTASCKDCFGRFIGVDASSKSKWVSHLSTGGEVVQVNGRFLRVRWVSGFLYCGTAEEGGEAFIVNNRYTALFYTPRGTKFVFECRQAYYNKKVVFDSFEAQLDFYLLINVK